MAEKKKRVHETVIREVVEKSHKKRPARRKPANSSASDKKIYDALVENFISLQKVMVNLSVKFDGLSSQISKLLELFEISAKALAEKDFSTAPEGKGNKEVLDKMNEIMEQNKIIARGLTLMHDKISEDVGIPYSKTPQKTQEAFQRAPPKLSIPSSKRMLPSQQPQGTMTTNFPPKKLESSDDTYQRSISSTNNGFDDSVQYTA